MALKWFLFRQSVSNTLTAPFRWHERRVAARREHELALARLQVEASTRPMAEMSRALVQVVEKLAEGQQASSKVLQSWLEGFRVAQQPASQAPPTDYQEYEREQATLREMEDAGLPANANPLETMRWLEQTLDS